jgi:hypothetical protein
MRNICRNDYVFVKPLLKWGYVKDVLITPTNMPSLYVINRFYVDVGGKVEVYMVNELMLDEETMYKN